MNFFSVILFQSPSQEVINFSISSRISLDYRHAGSTSNFKNLNTGFYSGFSYLVYSPFAKSIPSSSATWLCTHTQPERPIFPPTITPENQDL
ncbi:hypothetical protein EBX93_04175 [bacterium]|nr:hypothetical protein [bacterium]